MNIQRKHILVVEDDDSLRSCIAQVIQAEEIYDVTQCENGLVALEWLSKNKMPDLILTDFMMLGRGDDLAVMARKLKIPIIMITAAPELALEAMKKKNIKVAIMSKPIDIWTILETVDTMTGTNFEKIVTLNIAA